MMKPSATYLALYKTYTTLPLLVIVITLNCILLLAMDSELLSQEVELMEEPRLWQSS